MKTMAAEGVKTTRQAADVHAVLDQQMNLHKKVMGPRSAKALVVVNNETRQSQATNEGAGTAHLKQLKSKSNGKEVKYTDGEAADLAAPPRVHLIANGREDHRRISGKHLGAPIHAGCATGQVGAAHMQVGKATGVQLYTATVPKAKVKFKDKCTFYEHQKARQFVQSSGGYYLNKSEKGKNTHRGKVLHSADDCNTKNDKRHNDGKVRGKYDGQMKTKVKGNDKKQSSFMAMAGNGAIDSGNANSSKQ